jgi:hypothetical protein
MMGKELPKEELRYFYKEYLKQNPEDFIQTKFKRQRYIYKGIRVENSQNIRSKRGLVSFW